jgi:hypothetical protein
MLPPNNNKLLAVLCAIAGDGMRAVLRDAIGAYLAPHPPGLPLAERELRAAEIDEEIFALEWEEERLIEQAEEAGMEIEGRGDADPRAILGLARGASAE